MRNPLVLAAAHLAGVTRVFTIGGAQAIAALAYGTQTVPAVDKICGPGNAYVAAAKRRVFGTVGIDMVAGVSEIVVVADGTANPDWVALDLFSQAEHDEMAQAILLTPDAALIDARRGRARAGCSAEMPRAGIIAAVARAARRAGARRAISPRRARSSIASRPSTSSSRWPIPMRCCRRSATPARSSSVTMRRRRSATTARARTTCCRRAAPRASRSPLGVYDFEKRSSVLRLSQAAAQTLGPMAATLARGEGLIAHARSAEARSTND